MTQRLNRDAFTTKVDHWLDVNGPEACATNGALLIVDADHFKSVNDRFGHQSGDEAFKIIAATIKGVVRTKDHVGRLGGEEFGVFLPDTDPQWATAIAERIRRCISEAGFVPNGMPSRLTVSVGVVLLKRPMDYAELFKIADERLYKAMELGRDRVEIRRMVPSHEAVNAHVH